MQETTNVVLPREWYQLKVEAGVDCSRPGIYVWTIEEVGKYVGKYSDISRPRCHYGSIVRRHLKNLPYRKSNPNGFRRIHDALAEAVRNRNRITLTILENPAPEQVNARERELIRRIGNLND